MSRNSWADFFRGIYEIPGERDREIKREKETERARARDREGERTTLRETHTHKYTDRDRDRNRDREREKREREEDSCTARKASWNPAGVEPVHLKLAHIDSGSHVSGTNQKFTVVRS